MQATLLEQLAHIPASDPPVLSVYLDVRPLGSMPAERADLVKLRGRLHAIADSYWPRGVAYDELQRDVALLEDELTADLPKDAVGVAYFVASQHDLCRSYIATTPFAFEVAYAPTFHLYQLAKVAEHTPATVVVVVDRETARLFVALRGALREVEDLTEDARSMRQIHFFAGMGIKHYERHFDEHRRIFAREIAAELERLAHAEDATQIILAGNSEAIPWLRAELPADLRQVVLPVTIPVAIDEIPAEINTLIAPILAATAADAARAIGDRVVDALRAHGLGIAGLTEVRTLCELGQVDTLVLTDDAAIDLATRNDLVRTALATRAKVEFIAPHTVLNHLGGVGALLRYRQEAPLLTR